MLNIRLFIMTLFRKRRMKKRPQLCQRHLIKYSLIFMLTMRIKKIKITSLSQINSMRRLDSNKLKSRRKLEMKEFWPWTLHRLDQVILKKLTNTNKKCLKINNFKTTLVLPNLQDEFRLRIQCQGEELETNCLTKLLKKVIYWKLLTFILNLTKKVTYLKIDFMLKPVLIKPDSQKNKQCTITKWETILMRQPESTIIPW